MTEVVGEVSLDIYSGEPSATSSCIDVDIPEFVIVGQTLGLNAVASSGTMNALAYGPDEETKVLSLSDCDLDSLSDSYDLDLSHGVYQMTVIDWTNDPRCSLLVDHTLNVLKPQGQLSVPFTTN